MELVGPRFEEGEHRFGGAGGRRVGLHVEVDRAAGADPDRGRLGHRVFGRRRALGARRDRGQLGAAAAARGRGLEADVGGDQVPARGGLGADPAGTQVRLRAGAVFAADVDADAAERRFGPGRHRLARGGAAGVEAEAGEDRAADRGGGGGAAGLGGGGAGGARRISVRRPGPESAAARESAGESPVIRLPPAPTTIARRLPRIAPAGHCCSAEGPPR